MIHLVSPVGEPLIEPGTDPSELHRLVEELGFLERLGARARGLLSAGVPRDWVEIWSNGRRSHAFANLLFVQEETRLQSALRGAGIEAIPLKGVSLARILHGDPVARCVTDLDLGVRRAEVAKASAVLTKRGYGTCVPQKLLEREWFLRSSDEHASEAVFARNEGLLQLLVELHWNFLALDEGLLWSSLQTYEVSGPPVRALTPELYLLYLCAHATGHEAGSLRWLCDVADFLLAFSAQIDPVDFLRKCAAARLRRRARLAFDLLEVYFGLRWEPAETLRDAGDERVINRFLLRPLQPSLEESLLKIHADRMCLLDDSRQRMHYLGRLAQPTRIELLDRRGDLRSRPVAWVLRAARLAGLVLSNRISNENPSQTFSEGGSSRGDAPSS